MATRKRDSPTQVQSSGYPSHERSLRKSSECHGARLSEESDQGASSLLRCDEEHLRLVAYPSLRWPEKVSPSEQSESARKGLHLNRGLATLSNEHACEHWSIHHRLDKCNLGDVDTSIRVASKACRCSRYGRHGQALEQATDRTAWAVLRVPVGKRSCRDTRLHDAPDASRNGYNLCRNSYHSRCYSPCRNCRIYQFHNRMPRLARQLEHWAYRSSTHRQQT